MTKRIYSVLLLVVGLTILSCGPNKVPEGQIEYEITYPHSDVSGFMEAILPKTMTLTFKGTKMLTTIERGNIFSTKIISDEKDKSIEMRLDFGDKLFYTILDESDIETLIASQPVYDLKSTEESDSVQGMWSTRYSVMCKTDSVEHDDAWFTDDLAPTDAYWFSSYGGIQGVPVIYDVERYGIIMHLEATNFTKREVKENEFDRDPALVEINFDEYEAEVQELFDILMK